MSLDIHLGLTSIVRNAFLVLHTCAQLTFSPLKELSLKHSAGLRTCAHDGGWVLFVWEMRGRTQRRLWFYAQLEEFLFQLPSKKWRRIGSSAYLVRGEHSGAIRKLLRRFEGSGLDWREFRI